MGVCLPARIAVHRELGCLSTSVVLDLPPSTSFQFGVPAASLARPSVGCAAFPTVAAGWCRSVTDADVEVVAEFVLLEELNLSRTRVTDQGVLRLRGLSRVRQLSLAGCDVSDACFPAIARMTALTDLNCEWCADVSSACLEYIRLLPRLKVGRRTVHSVELVNGIDSPIGRRAQGTRTMPAKYSSSFVAMLDGVCAQEPWWGQ